MKGLFIGGDNNVPLVSYRLKRVFKYVKQYFPATGIPYKWYHVVNAFSNISSCD